MFNRVSMVMALIALVVSPGLRADEHQPATGHRVGSDTFFFGGSVRIDQPVAGDLIAAGGNVDVDAPVAGDAVLAGGNLRITAQVEGSVHAGGGRLILDAPIGRNVRVGGGQVDVGPMAAIGGNVTVGGGQITLRGPVKGNVTAAIVVTARHCVVTQDPNYWYGAKFDDRRAGSVTGWREFVPFVYEIFGAVGPKADGLLRALSRTAFIEDGERARYLHHTRTMLCILLMRGNAGIDRAGLAILSGDRDLAPFRYFL